MLDWKSDWKSNQTSDWKLVLMLDQMLDRMYTNWLYCLDEKKRTGVKWTFKKKHCQRHNGPRVLSLKLEWSLKLKWIQIHFSQKGNSSYRLNTLGALCLWQCCFTSDLYFIWMNNNPICSKGLFRWPSLALVPILAARLRLNWLPTWPPSGQLVAHWRHQLVLSCYPHQPESHQLSLQNLLYWLRDIRTHRSDPRDTWVR